MKRSVERPIAVPSFARGYEATYSRFIRGKLVFDNGEGQRREFPFTPFANTLEGEFDLSGLKYKYCDKMRDVSEYLRIKLGVRTSKENEDKVTVWITPKFLVDQKGCADWKRVSWTSDVGIFWSWGNWDLKDFRYLITQGFDEISSQNLLKLYDGRRAAACDVRVGWTMGRSKVFYLYF